MPVLTGRCLIDTNVLIYATLRNDDRFAAARQVLQAARDREFAAFITVQNLAEMYPNLTGPKSKPPDSPAVARTKIQSISGLRYLEILPITVQVIERALELCESRQIRKQDYFDMQLAAVMLLESIPTIVTENASDFAGIDGISTINPF
jgi:predicted nucleic acid-binding protein